MDHAGPRSAFLREGDLDRDFARKGCRAPQPPREGCMSPVVAVRPEGANHQWRKNPPGELSIDPVADERLVRVTARAGASLIANHLHLAIFESTPEVRVLSLSCPRQPLFR